VNDTCPRHPENVLYPRDGHVRRCLHPGCRFESRGPAPEPTYTNDYEDRA